MDFTASTESIDQLAEARVERLITMLKEVGRYGHISLESQQELHLFPHDELTRDAEVNLGLETVVSHIKSTLKAIVAAVAKIWRKAVEWLVSLFSRRKQDAEKTQANWDTARNAKDAVDEWMRQNGRTNTSGDKAKQFREVLDKHLPALAGMSNGLTDDLNSLGKLAQAMSTIRLGLKTSITTFTAGLVKFNEFINTIKRDPDHLTLSADHITNVLKLMEPQSLVMFAILRRAFQLGEEQTDAQVIAAVKATVQHTAGQRATHPLTFKDYHWGADSQYSYLQSNSEWFIANETQVTYALQDVERELRALEAIGDQSLSSFVRNVVNQTLVRLKARLMAIHHALALVSDLVTLEHRISTVFKQAYTEACHAVGISPESKEAKDYLVSHTFR